MLSRYSKVLPTPVVIPPMEDKYEFATSTDSGTRHEYK